MSFTGSEIKVQAQRLLVDIEDDAYSSDMLSYINEAQRRFASETHCCQQVISINLLNDNRITYAQLIAKLGAQYEDILSIAKVAVKTSSSVSFLPKATLTETKDVSTNTLIPTRYTVFADSIYFDIHPDTNCDVDLLVYCSVIPADITAIASELLIPYEWIQAIVHYVVYCCHIADRDAGLANGSFASYEQIKVQAATTYAMNSEG